ncbi:MAG: D-2-hydroxyacid dehydrogenase [Candidatus Sericytochromatia bacterium]|nr:D-2-hydroxyacid dehydrogenase [Candidatus Sericytochromatia bacterium]
MADRRRREPALSPGQPARHHLVFLDRATLPVPLRRPAFAHTWAEHPQTAPAEVIQRLAGATVAITNKVPLTREALAAIPSLRLVAVAATGTDVVDLSACAEAGVAVTNVRNYAGGAVAEHVFTLLLALRRSLLTHLEVARGGAWSASGQFCFHGPAVRDLEGSTLGLIGHGVLSQSVQMRAEAFGMRVLVAERRGATVLRPGRLAFDEVLAASDVISLHCPLTSETRHLIDRRALALMRPQAILINTARGGLIDASALLQALDEGRLAGAGLDVLDTEPPPTDHPLLRRPDPRLIITPHVAWASTQSMARLGEQLVSVIEAWEQGHPRNLVSLS